MPHCFKFLIKNKVYNIPVTRLDWLPALDLYWMSNSSSLIYVLFCTLHSRSKLFAPTHFTISIDGNCVMGWACDPKKIPGFKAWSPSHGTTQSTLKTWGLVGGLLVTQCVLEVYIETPISFRPFHHLIMKWTSLLFPDAPLPQPDQKINSSTPTGSCTGPPKLWAKITFSLYKLIPLRHLLQQWKVA